MPETSPETTPERGETFIDEELMLTAAERPQQVASAFVEQELIDDAIKDSVR